MKNIIKKINLLAIGAMIVASGFAFATVNDDQPNVYLHPETGVWTPLDEMNEEADYLCDGLSNQCTGYLAPGSAIITDIKPGTFVKRTL